MARRPLTPLTSTEIELPGSVSAGRPRMHVEPARPRSRPPGKPVAGGRHQASGLILTRQSRGDMTRSRWKADGPYCGARRTSPAGQERGAGASPRVTEAYARPLPRWPAGCLPYSPPPEPAAINAVRASSAWNAAAVTVDANLQGRRTNLPAALAMVTTGRPGLGRIEQPRHMRTSVSAQQAPVRAVPPALRPVSAARRKPRRLHGARPGASWLARLFGG